MRRAIYAGSFDPIHQGHYDLIVRAASLCDELIIGVGTNVAKSVLFPLDKRLDYLAQALAPIPNVRVETFSGLLVEFVQQSGAQALVRGLRHGGDLEGELPMALMNRQLEGSAETLFLIADPRWQHLSSSLIKEVARFGGDVSRFLPTEISQRLSRDLASALKGK